MIEIVKKVLIILCFFITSSQMVIASGFSDVKTDFWAYKEITELVAKNIVAGYEDGTFKPDQIVTRAEFAKMLSLVMPQQQKIKSTILLSDVSNDEWYYDYIQDVKPYMNNVGGKFYPDEPALREDVAVALVNVLDMQSETADYATLRDSISDFSKISPKNLRGVAIAYKEKFISGYNDKTLKPMDCITRAETATLLYRVFIKDAKPFVKKIEPIIEKPYVQEELFYYNFNGTFETDSKNDIYFATLGNKCLYKFDIKENTIDVVVDLSKVDFRFDKEYPKGSFTSDMSIFTDEDKERVFISGRLYNSNDFEYVAQITPEFKVLSTGGCMLKNDIIQSYISDDIMRFTRHYPFKVIDENIYRIGPDDKPMYSISREENLTELTFYEYYNLNLKTGVVEKGVKEAKKYKDVARNSTDLSEATKSKDTIIFVASPMAKCRGLDGSMYIYDMEKLKCVYNVSTSGATTQKMMRTEEIQVIGGDKLIPTSNFLDREFKLDTQKNMIFYDYYAKKMMRIRKI